MILDHRCSTYALLDRMTLAKRDDASLYVLPRVF